MASRQHGMNAQSRRCSKAAAGRRPCGRRRRRWPLSLICGFPMRSAQGPCSRAEIVFATIRVETIQPEPPIQRLACGVPIAITMAGAPRPAGPIDIDYHFDLRIGRAAIYGPRRWAPRARTPCPFRADSFGSKSAPRGAWHQLQRFCISIPNGPAPRPCRVVTEHDRLGRWCASTARSAAS
jgi:hypothetical protein